ncbi:nucleoside diphosphate kinase b [Perkinsela sp. CCAP 1560/4]|nr:nucleoside diphosphate kinase b [Perkinsela sp. CCAP 1560/4]|eukprot:KNH05451.1 nucleoside diphosphate kinase b [Perkinsela sp. CCAP 1560/4]
MAIERTFIAIKPDGVQRGLVGDIIARFEKKGYQLIALKMIRPTLQQSQEHYIDLMNMKFYDGLCKFMSSGPIIAMVWEGENVVKGGRMLLGETRPEESLPGTIRGDLCVHVGRNVCHGSDSVESANREIAFWFKEEQIISWENHSKCWLYE